MSIEERIYVFVPRKYGAQKTSAPSIRDGISGDRTHFPCHRSWNWHGSAVRKPERFQGYWSIPIHMDLRNGELGTPNGRLFHLSVFLYSGHRHSEFGNFCERPSIPAVSSHGD